MPPPLKERPSSLLEAAPPSRRKSRYALLETGDPADRRRTIGLGIVLTIGVWLLCLFLFNLLITHLDHQHTSNTGDISTPKPSFDIELQPEEFLLPKPPPPPPQNFVETNPDAPENIPDKTDNFGAHNQQAAQETPTPGGKSDRPAIEGQDEIDSTQIVSGDLRQQPIIETPPPPPPTPELKESSSVTEVTPAQREQNPLSGEQKIQGDSETGYGMNEYKLPEALKNITPDATEHTQGLPDAPLITGVPQTTQPQIDPKRPQPRITLNRQKVRPAIFKENKFGTQNIGAMAYDAKWSNYGQYLQKLIDTVQIQFEDLNEKSRFWPPTGTKVTVRFILDSEGKIAEIVEADGNGGSQATQICISAITDRAPYGKWTDDMVAILGEKQEMTFTFYYGRP
ncbi:hypothetical protein M2103_001545 [Ereboglobus sp. PH5-5]|uniref:hypothetical protein n=1 Tax=Ereboglobus sp. PH5-5 TaxID=2940529 RepID=UPI002404C780|nr:hypothetical protein [Ereboglobus sp. PH5-5]MDF9833322.1 hypothetical protein [Ereboglobus sp. PH5-5]